MAPFKLKFRMGGSRSTSSEHEGDAVVSVASSTGGSTIVTNTTNTTNQGSHSVINSTTSLIHFGSTSTIDSDHNTDSLVSLGNNDQRALLQNCGQTSTDSIGKCKIYTFSLVFWHNFYYMLYIAHVLKKNI